MKVLGPKDNAEQSQPGMTHTSGNGSGIATAAESQSLDIERSGSRGLADSKATGPRTKQGKQTSSRNATKHGLFSKVIVLKGESRAEYEAVLAGLRETLQPEGTLEELLVEKLATLAWRQRRLLLAESAEIRKNTEFVESDQRNQEREAAQSLWSISALLCGRGLIGNTHNRYVLEQCLQGLADLRKGVEEVGFRPDQDTLILQKLYGDRDVGRLRPDLYDSYETWLQIAKAPEEECKRKVYLSPEDGRRIFIEKIDTEIRRIKRDQKARASIETARTQLEILCRNVPDAPGLDRLLRYEASLERAFDRTLIQLERLQRMRLGQSVLPPIQVGISL
jgi:hypothetical protein